MNTNSGYRKMTGKEFRKTLHNTGAPLKIRKNLRQANGEGLLIGDTLFVSEEDFSKLSRIETAQINFDNLIITKLLDKPATEYNSFNHKSFFHNLNTNKMPGTQPPFSGFGSGRRSIIDIIINNHFENPFSAFHRGSIEPETRKPVSVYDGMKVKVKENIPVLGGQVMTIVERVGPLLDKLIEVGMKSLVILAEIPEWAKKENARVRYLVSVYEARCELKEDKNATKKAIYIAKMGDLEFILQESEFESVTEKAA